MGSTGTNQRFWRIGSELHKKTLVFFTLLILLASGLSIVAIYHHSRGATTLDSIIALNEKGVAETPAALNDEAKDRGHAGLENGLAALTIILVSVLTLFMFFFIRNIIQPLDKLEKMTGALADGRLDQLVGNGTKAGCSIAMIGENVNTLAMNLQEVLLLVWNLSEHNLEKLEEIVESLGENDELSRERIRMNLREIKAELEQMQDLTRQFEFFDVILQDKKALAKNERPRELA